MHCRRTRGTRRAGASARTSCSTFSTGGCPPTATRILGLTGDRHLDDEGQGVRLGRAGPRADRRRVQRHLAVPLPRRSRAAPRTRASGWPRSRSTRPGTRSGLEHCPNRGCLMEDAEGRVATCDREYDFCARCRKLLADAGRAAAGDPRHPLAPPRVNAVTRLLSRDRSWRLRHGYHARDASARRFGRGRAGGRVRVARLLGSAAAEPAAAAALAAAARPARPERAARAGTTGARGHDRRGGATGAAGTTGAAARPARRAPTARGHGGAARQRRTRRRGGAAERRARRRGRHRRARARQRRARRRGGHGGRGGAAGHAAAAARAARRQRRHGRRRDDDGHVHDAHAVDPARRRGRRRRRHQRRRRRSISWRARTGTRAPSFTLGGTVIANPPTFTMNQYSTFFLTFVDDVNGDGRPDVIAVGDAGGGNGSGTRTRSGTRTPGRRTWASRGRRPRSSAAWSPTNRPRYVNVPATRSASWCS